jgi:hypothetical protein
MREQNPLGQGKTNFRSTAIRRNKLSSKVGIWELPAAIQTLRPAALEVEARPSRMSQIEVVDYRPKHQDHSTFLT